MPNTTLNTQALIRAQLYSDQIQRQLEEGALPTGLHRDVTEFKDGDSIQIPVMGETVIRDYVEDTDVQYDAIDTGAVSLQISQYKSGATYVTQKFIDDSYLSAELQAEIPRQHLKKLKDEWETALMAAHNNALTSAVPNAVNGIDHRWVAGTGANNVIHLEDFLYMKLAFDKAYVDEENRIAVVDSISEAAINKLAADQGFANNPQFEGILNEGFASGRRFVRHIFGWDVYVSDKLPRIASETVVGGPQGTSTGITDGIANIFLSAADDNSKPVMGAMRGAVRTDGEWNKDKQRFEFVTTQRYGFGTHRKDTVGVVVSSASNYK